MKYKNHFLASFSAVLLLCLLLTSCQTKKISEKTDKKYLLPEAIAAEPSGILAENERFSLVWDYEQMCLILKNLQSGVCLSSTPYEYYTAGSHENLYRDSGLCSSLLISYVEPEQGAQVELNSYENAEFIAAEAIKNGIRLTYYFSDVSISVPVEYTLTEDGIAAKVLIDKIGQADNLLYSVSVLPFFAACKNDTASYMFVPSGCGALMKVDSGKREIRKYSEKVYGDDPTVQAAYQNSKTDAVRMPVFGVHTPSGGIFGQITEGAELATIQAQAGDEQYGYSCVYPTFALRSHATSMIKDYDDNKSIQINQYTGTMVNLNSVTVEYTVLDAENSDYNAMAAIYRESLKEQTDRDADFQIPELMLTVSGGTKERKNLLGIPYQTTATLTTYDQVREMLSEIVSQTGASAVVNLKGFGQHGLEAARIADGFELSKRYGSEKSAKKLFAFAEQNNIVLTQNFNLIFFRKNGLGYSMAKAARNANSGIAKYYPYDLVTHALETDFSPQYLLGRYDLARIGGRLTSAAKENGVSGIGISELSSTVYSDCNDPLYYVGAHMSDDVQRVIKKIKAGGLTVVSESANAYAAVRSDYVINAPTTSSKYRCFDAEIPFYQLVFRGIVPLSGEAVNLAQDADGEMLHCAATASSPYFAVNGDNIAVSVMEEYPNVAFGVYPDLKDRIFETVRLISPLLKRVGNAEMISYEKNGDVSHTVFDNGVSVYVNFGEADVQTPLGKVQARSFLYE